MAALRPGAGDATEPVEWGQTAASSTEWSMDDVPAERAGRQPLQPSQTRVNWLQRCQQRY